MQVVEVDAAGMEFAQGFFDAVFSNAALHWMKNADAVESWRGFSPDFHPATMSVASL